MKVTKKLFQNAAKKGQQNLREKIGEEAYIARLKKIGKKGGKKTKELWDKKSAK